MGISMFEVVKDVQNVAVDSLLKDKATSDLYSKLLFDYIYPAARFSKTYVEVALDAYSKNTINNIISVLTLIGFKVNSSITIQNNVKVLVYKISWVD